jgi:hypothetical protein
VTTLDATFLAIIVAGCPVAAYAMIRMMWAGFKAGAGLWDFLSGTAILASYNRTNFIMFAACIAAMIAMAILYNVLFVTGRIPP